jgi:hypoxanthine phosphoribosyltransferase
MILEPLIKADAIQAKVQELAAKVCVDGDENILLVGVLKGSLHFLSDLSRSLRCEVEIDFISVSSYADGKKSSGIVQIRKDLDTNIEGRNVLIVEDIVDTGATLRHLRELLGTRKPRSLKVVSLLSKLQARGLSSDIEYVGFEIPDEFVVGYGLDYGERYRNLPYIAILREG